MLVLGMISVLAVAIIIASFATWHANTHKTEMIKHFTSESATQGLVFSHAASTAVSASGTMTAASLEKKGDLANGFNATTPYGRHWTAKSSSGNTLAWTAGKPTDAGGGVRLTKTGIKSISWKVAGKLWNAEGDPNAIIGVIPAGTTTLTSYHNAFQINVSAWVSAKPYARTAIYFGAVR